MSLARKLALCVTIAAVAVALIGPAWAGEATGEKIKVLFLQGGGHNWRKHFPILIKELDKTGDFAATLTQNLDDLKADNIKQYDAVLFYGSGLNFKNEEQEKGVCDFVRNGGAFIGIHSASDAFKKSAAYWAMLGGRFAGHGGGKFTVRIMDKEHPITKGLEDFEIQDETYRHRYAPGFKPHNLVRMDRGKEQQCMAWAHAYGKGRVFYTALGHGTPAWVNPHFQRLVVRGMYWAVGREPKDP